MFAKRLIRLVLLILLCAPFCPDNVSARQTILSGSAGVGYEYWDRKYEKQVVDNTAFSVFDEDTREYFARVEIELLSQGIHDTLSLRYAPEFRYDDLQYTTDVDHYLVAEGERSLTKDWQVSITDTYVLSNNPERYTTPFADAGYTEAKDTETVRVGDIPDTITYNYGRRRFWTNDLNAETRYTYAQKSEVGFGYTFKVLRNDSVDEELGPIYDEYDRHEFSGRLSRMFSSVLSSNLDLRYIKGLYDNAQAVPGVGETVLSRDLEEYRGNLGVDYLLSINDSFSSVYRYLGTRYEDDRRDNSVHELTLGWLHSFDQDTNLNLAAGPSYIDIDGLNGEWGYNALMNFTKTYQRGNISSTVSKLYAPQNFTGGEDSGLSDITDVNLDAMYQVTQELSVTLFGQYRYEDILDPTGTYYNAGLGADNPQDEQDVGDVTYSRERFSVGAGLQYTFLRWFTASLNYSYRQQDGDLDVDTYEDHQIIFQISASKELWRQ